MSRGKSTAVRRLVRGIDPIPKAIESEALFRACDSIHPARQAAARLVASGAKGTELRRLRKIEAALLYCEQHIRGGFPVDDKGRLV